MENVVLTSTQVAAKVVLQNPAIAQFLANDQVLLMLSTELLAMNIKKVLLAMIMELQATLAANYAARLLFGNFIRLNPVLVLNVLSQVAYYGFVYYSAYQIGSIIQALIAAKEAIGRGNINEGLNQIPQQQRQQVIQRLAQNLIKTIAVTKYLQYDPKWRDFIIDAKGNWTMRNGGCYITSMASGMSSHGLNINPGELAEKLKEKKRIDNNGDLVADPFVDFGYDKIMDSTYNFDRAVEEFQNGNIVIFKIEQKDNQGRAYVHFILMTGINQNGTFTVMDPAGKIEMIEASGVKELRVFKKR